MERLVKGNVVVVRFPFSDLSASKLRPALVMQPIQGNDVLLCQITRYSHYPSEELDLATNDFQRGSLRETSHLRFSKLFTLDRSLVRYTIGSLKPEKMREIIQKICEKIFQYREILKAQAKKIAFHYDGKIDILEMTIGLPVSSVFNKVNDTLSEARDEKTNEVTGYRIHKFLERAATKNISYVLPQKVSVVA